MYLLGSHVGMSGKEMMLGSVKDAISYGANTFMLYTGAPQNTKRKKIEELNIGAARQMMEENGIWNFVVHAPYIINLANTIKPETFQIATDFLKVELERTEAMGSETLVLHPGAHVGAGVEAGIAQIIKGLDMVMKPEMKVKIALETMAGKGSEIGRSFEEIKAIYEGVRYPENLRVCFDTCHVNDAGYDIVNQYEEVLQQFDDILGLEQIAVFHINDSKNPMGAHKDRHENIGFGTIGFDALYRVVSDKRFEKIPKILETPWLKPEDDPKHPLPPYKEEIEMLQSGKRKPLTIS
ncbi:MAG: deoxyribonuclease IV [Clostridiales bacterium]|nr:deoxyribonuclease IV [Clostridiales bacterium]MDY3774554.1 deoxyribonuclease IV [Eubacterium sp.]